LRSTTRDMPGKAEGGEEADCMAKQAKTIDSYSLYPH
jgi:hypothetical protein